MPIEVNSEDIPKFESKEDLGEWFTNIFKNLGSVTIDDTGINIDLYKSNAEREASKRRLQKEENKAVAQAFKDIVEKSIKVDERTADERHKHDQDVYYNKLKLGDDKYDVDIFVDYLQKNDAYRYAGHSATKIDNEKSTRDLQISKIIIHTKVDNFIITNNQEDFNPENNKAQNNKEQDMTLLDELKKLVNRVENRGGNDMEKVENAKTDKRKLIDEIGGILKGKVDDELIRTIIKKAEEIAYDESEAGTADNKKAKNETEEKEEKEEKFDPREYMGPGRTAVKEMVIHKMRDVLGTAGHAKD